MPMTAHLVIIFYDLMEEANERACAVAIPNRKLSEAGAGRSMCDARSDVRPRS